MKAKDHWIYESQACQYCGYKTCDCEEELEIAVTEVEQTWSVPTKQEIRE